MVGFSSIDPFHKGLWSNMVASYPDDTTEVFTFKDAAGRTVGTVTVTYTDNTKASINTVVKS